MKLRDYLPEEALGCEYERDAFRKFLDCEVTTAYGIDSGVDKAWPGTHKNVYCWWILDNGKAVGFNENHGRGWSFPVTKISE